MGFQEAVKKGWEMIKLNRVAYREVAADPEVFSQAILITALAGFASALSPPFHFWQIIGDPIRSIVGLFIGVGILHFVANLMGGRGDFMALFRVLGIGRVLGFALILPVLGPIINLWFFPMAVIAVEEIYGFERNRAILCVVVPFAAIFAILLVVSLIAGVAALGGFMLSWVF